MPSLFFTTRQRGIQRELPSTLTNGQKVGRMFQRKMFHVCSIFFGWYRRSMPGTVILPISRSAEGECGLLEALHDPVNT